MAAIDPDALAAALDVHGLIARGSVDLDPAEAPAGVDGHPVACVLLVGHAGGTIWPHFSRWRAVRPSSLANPLDAWSREVLDGVAGQFGAKAVFPSDRPYLPFQQWAMRAEGLKPSPLGILMHPVYGLWHAYRGALLFGEPLAAAFAIHDDGARVPVHLCDACAAKPCLKACPVAAHSIESFDYAGCVDHVRSPGGGDCRSFGCLDRNACPFGAQHRYSAEQQAFHMAAFAGL